MLRTIVLRSAKDLSPVRPSNPAFFTGNPIYFTVLSMANAFMRRHELPFSGQAPVQSVPWMSQSEMESSHNMKLSREMYGELMHRLNSLFSKQAKDQEIRRFLVSFLRPGASLTRVVPGIPKKIDEDGKTYSFGNRKAAKAQVWMIRGTGEFYVNGVPLAEYFDQKDDKISVLRPLVMSGMLGKYNTWAVVENGGPTGQSDAIGLAVARALKIHEPRLESIFKSRTFFPLIKLDFLKRTRGEESAKRLVGQGPERDRDGPSVDALIMY